MARVALLCPDLLFGSKVEGGLVAAGHEMRRADTEEAAASAVAGGAEVLVVDLGGEGVDGPALVESLRARGELAGTATLGFYPHVEQETRRRAEAAGFDLVVPRSRMAREMGALVDRILAPGAAKATIRR
jgi:DNA-binding NarL/FixJ family response regulator